MSEIIKAYPPIPRPRAVAWGTGLTGFAFGGFIDGILLHQILQWHHLLSEVTDPTDLPFQIFADGWFHALMYVAGIAGIGVLWAVRTSLGIAGTGARLLAWFLIGFGLWHVVDAVVVHWLLGLHRIRPDSDDVLFWDLVFFALGLVFVAAGLAARRTASRRATGT